MNRLSVILISILLSSLATVPSSPAMTVGSLDRLGNQRTQGAGQGPAEKRPVNQTNNWIPVPAWLAGSWETNFQTFLDSYDCRTGKQLLKEPISLPVSKHRTTGFQQDSSGQIWHYASTPYLRTSETESYLESQTIEQLDLLGSTASEVKIRTVGKVERTSKEPQGTISFYEVTTVTYSQVGEGLVKTDLTITDYDTNGKAVLHSISVCVERRVKPFSIVNHNERGDLREMFLRFCAQREGASRNER